MNYFKKYKKYKNAGLPIMAYNKGKLEYIRYNKVLNKKGKMVDDVFVYDDFIEVIEDTIETGFYYPYNSLIRVYDDNGKYHDEVGHSHSHTFSSVVHEVYYNPHVFSIDSEDREYYSKQEYDFLMRLKNYLLVIEREDIKYDATIDEINDLALNELASKYKEYPTLTFRDDNVAPLIIDKKKKYFYRMKTEYTKPDIGSRYLLIDNDSKYLGVLEVIKENTILINDLTEKDIDYKLEGYRSLNTCKKELKKLYSEHYKVDPESIELVIKTVKVIRKFR